MYATMLHIDLRAIASARDRARTGRSLGKTLAALAGFVAFIAFEADDGDVSGLCICEDLASLENAEQAVVRWQREQAAMPDSSIRAISKGNVIVQQGL